MQSFRKTIQLCPSSKRSLSGPEAKHRPLREPPGRLGELHVLVAQICHVVAGQAERQGLGLTRGPVPGQRAGLEVVPDSLRRAHRRRGQASMLRHHKRESARAKTTWLVTQRRVATLGVTTYTVRVLHEHDRALEPGRVVASADKRRDIISSIGDEQDRVRRPRLKGPREAPRRPDPPPRARDAVLGDDGARDAAHAGHLLDVALKVGGAVGQRGAVGAQDGGEGVVCALARAGQGLLGRDADRGAHVREGRAVAGDELVVGPAVAPLEAREDPGEVGEVEVGAVQGRRRQLADLGEGDDLGQLGPEPRVRHVDDGPHAETLQDGPVALLDLARRGAVQGAPQGPGLVAQPVEGIHDSVGVAHRVDVQAVVPLLVVDVAVAHEPGHPVRVHGGERAPEHGAVAEAPVPQHAVPSPYAVEHLEHVARVRGGAHVPQQARGVVAVWSLARRREGCGARPGVVQDPRVRVDGRRLLHGPVLPPLRRVPALDPRHRRPDPARVQRHDVKVAAHDRLDLVPVVPQRPHARAAGPARVDEHGAPVAPGVWRPEPGDGEDDALARGVFGLEPVHRHLEPRAVVPVVEAVVPLEVTAGFYVSPREPPCCL